MTTLSSSKEVATKTFFAELEHFNDEIKAISQASKNIRRWLTRAKHDTIKRTNEYLKENAALVEESQPPSYKFEHPGHFIEFDRLSKNIASIDSAERHVPQALFMSLFSRFEALSVSLIQFVALHRSDIFIDREARYSLNEISKFSTIDEFYSNLIGMRTDEVARKSPYELLKFFRSQLSVVYDLDLLWPKFIEASERRNCAAHNNCRVSRQYLITTSEVGYKHQDGLTPGDSLPLEPEYVDTTARIVLEVGVKIALLTVKAVDSSEYSTHRAVSMLGKFALDSIEAQEYGLAEQLCRFGTEELVPDMALGDRLVYDLNLAQIHKWRGEDSSLQTLINQIDWTAASERFLLARDVLLDKFDEAAIRMPRVAGEPPDYLPAHAFLSWPIFKQFRESDEFSVAFENAFGLAPLTRESVDEHESPEDHDVSMM